MTLAVGHSMRLYETALQREREAELGRVGNLYKSAIQDYYRSAPGEVKTYPQSLQDLLHDPRHLVTRRYLRHLYPDPVTLQEFRVLKAPQGGIWGIASTSSQTPWRERPPDGVQTGDVRVPTYAAWMFIADGDLPDGAP